MKTHYLKLPSGTVLRSENPILWPEAKRLSVAEGKRLLREEAIAHLKATLPPGATVYGFVIHVARSGMSRKARFVAVRDGRIESLTGWMGDALDWPHDGAEWLRLDGCGMDMLFHAVDSLSRVLGFPLENRGL